jgi:RNA polymerase sigma-70 factor, ECF subfamily
MTSAPDFDTLYEDGVDPVWRMLQRFGVPESGLEDAVQEVFIVAHRQLPGFRGESTLKTWLGGIAVKVARDARRRVSRKGGLETLDDHPELESPLALEDEAIRKQALGRLLGLLEQLDQEQREVFVLAELEEFSAPEISALTGTNVNTIYTRLRAARQRFNALVAERGEEWR